MTDTAAQANEDRGAIETSPSEQEIARLALGRNAEDVQPTGATLPRPWEEYRLEAEFTNHEQLMVAVRDALEETTLTPLRYAELMWILDSWFVEARDISRRETIARGQRRFLAS